MLGSEEYLQSRNVGTVELTVYKAAAVRFPEKPGKAAADLFPMQHPEDKTIEVLNHVPDKPESVFDK